MEKGRICVRANRVLGCCAICHAALVLITLRVVMPFRLPDWWYDNTTWVALASLWPMWLIVLALHSGRSWTRFAVPTFLGLLLLLPCIRFYWREAPEAFGVSQMPTLEKPIVEDNQDLGSGFRRVILAEVITGGFEGIYHGEYLYFRDRKPLSDDHLGFHVFLFRASDQKIIQLTQEPRYDFDGFEWDEAAGYVLLRHQHGGPLETIPLPKA